MPSSGDYSIQYNINGGSWTTATKGATTTTVTGLSLSNVVNIIEPEVICLGGGFVYFEKILYTRLIEKMKSNKYKFNVPKVVLAQLGNDAGIIGATLI